jgi:formylmethanofuran dehydrogenase subunit C
MKGVRLSMMRPPRQRLDLSPLLPERLAGVPAGEIGAIELQCGNRRMRVDDFFRITPGEGTTLVIRNRGAKLDYVGRAMSSGELVIEGDCEAYAGLSMSGGRLRIRGKAGPFAGAAMLGGILELEGDAGDWLGGGLPGERRGMSGGLIIVRGDAGDRAADRQRRGIILIQGTVGNYLGARMLAGTTIVLGEKIGLYPGFAMKRGSLLLLGSIGRMLPTFLDSGVHELGFLNLLLAHLRAHAPQFAAAAGRLKQLRRLVGDGAANGKGEILVPAD